MIKFEIVEQIGVLAENSATGWRKELNRVSWNEGQPKYDIRDWSEDHCLMSRGVTLTDAEMQALMKAMLERKETK